MKKWIPRVKRNTLLFIAGLVWLIAGFNILRIGTPGMIASWSSPVIPLLCAAVIFALFFQFVFYSMVNKHCRRIRSYEEERIPVYRFFDKKGYVVMTCMITFGVLLRASNLVPPLYLGTFYTGLGASLMCAGIFFFIRFLTRYAETAQPLAEKAQNATANDSLPQDMVEDQGDKN